MGKPKQSRSSRMKSGSTVAKGHMLERIVAEMHRQEGAITQTNVQLPPLHSPQGVKREIDVLVTARVVNQEVRIAFECKNERRRTGTQDIDVFVSKLEYVGLPVRGAVFVSVAGYTRGALENAKERGIKALRYEDVNKTLPLEVIKAVQSTLYVICEAQNVTLTSTLPPAPEDSTSSSVLAFVYFEQDGQIHQMFLGDLLWHMWAVDGSLPDKLGMHEVELPVPQGAFMMKDGQRYPILFEPLECRPRASVEVVGFVFTIEGETSRHRLTNAQSKATESLQINATFDRYAKPTVQAVSTEEQFQELRKPNGRLQVIAERFRMPRIVWNNVYWPPSQRVMDALREKTASSQSDERLNREALRLEDLEGTNLASVWDPISPEWPLYNVYYQHEEDADSHRDPSPQ